MRKGTPLAVLVVTVCLGGCILLPAGPREVTDKAMTVYLTEAVPGMFTGAMEESEGVLTGNGVFTADAGWRFEGTVAGDRLVSGTVENLPWAVDFGNIPMPGLYTGPVSDGLPAGEGSFSADADGTFTGTFDAGAAMDGEARELPVSVFWGEAEYSGLFSGTLSQGVPGGRGTFTGENAARQALTWDGGWNAGVPSGEGNISADKLVTQVDGVPLAGSYTGQGRDGVPAGDGDFISVNTQGVPFTYRGEWADGLMDGQGVLRYGSESYYVRAGTFTAGAYTPTWMETLRALGTCEPRFTLTEGQEAYISQFPDLWEEPDHQRFNNSPYKELAERRLQIQNCLDDPQSFVDEPGWLYQYSLRTVRSEVVALSGNGPEMTCITAADGSYTQVVRVIVPEALEPLTRGMRFHVYAIPLAVSEYTTVLGQTQTCLVMLAGDIYVDR